jgi:NAD+ diphosphatase
MTDLHPIIANWYHYCPNCKSDLIKEGSSAKCSHCSFAAYINPAPTITALAVKNGQVLLTRRGIEPKKDMLDFPGGFIQPNETAEEATHREIKEELGVDATIVTQLGSPMPDIYSEIQDPTLNFLYLIELKDETIVPQDDVASITWMDIDDIPLDQLAFENCREILKRYKEYIKEHHDS